METLQAIFPDIPAGVLSAVLGISEANIALASNWLLSNDWTTLILNPAREGNHTRHRIEQEDEDEEHENGNRHGMHFFHGDEDDEDDEDEEEEEDEDEDEEEDDDGDIVDVDADENYFAQRIQPLAKRRRISITDKSATTTTTTGNSTPTPSLNNAFEKEEERYLVAFDDHLKNGELVQKTLIELLNTSLTKLAHQQVVVSNHEITQASGGEPRTLDSILSRSLPSPSCCGTGYWGYYFPITELDMIWRSILHGHLISRRFADTIEFHCLWATRRNPLRHFDELAHTHERAIARWGSNLGAAADQRNANDASTSSQDNRFQCLMVLPCGLLEAQNENEQNDTLPTARKNKRDDMIFDIGKHLHMILKLKQTPLYYHSGVGPPSLSEEYTAASHKKHSHYRVFLSPGAMSSSSGTATVSSSYEVQERNARGKWVTKTAKFS